MKLHFEITREDYADFNKFHFITTKLRNTIIIGIVWWIVFLLYINRDKIDLNISILFTFIYILIYSCIYYYDLKKTKNIPLNNGTILGEKNFELTDSQIKYKTSNSEGFYEWNIAKKLKENTKSFYIYIDNNMAILIPKRAFKNIDEIDEFRNLVCQKINSSETKKS